MDPSSQAFKSQDDLNDKADKRDIKPVVKTLNRVPRKLVDTIFLLQPFIQSHFSRCLCEHRSYSCVR